MLFTICTATYNRAHTLNRTFDSLMCQSEKDFEWLVIDDGSTDKTDALVRKWQAIAPFPIRYEYQPNQGKHIAVNLGAAKARGELFIIADSDDEFPSNALEILANAWRDIPDALRDEFTGVTGHCITDDGALVGDLFPEDVFDSRSADVTYKYGIRGEKWGFHRTEVIRQFPFPAIAGTPFISEGIIWNAIGRRFKTRFINQPVRIYKQDAGNQLTKRSAKEKSAECMFHIMYLNADHDYLHVAPWRFLKTAIQASRYSFHNCDGVRSQFAKLEQFKIKILWAMTLPVGFCLYLVDRIKTRA